MIPKQKREIDKKYLAYIRKQPCLVYPCPFKSSAHHDPSKGSGGSDYETLPLCEEGGHHIEGVHKLGRETFQKKLGLDFDADRIRLLMGYIEEICPENVDSNKVIIQALINSIKELK